MGNAELAAVFAEMADLMDILGQDAFRVNSYRRVARLLADASADLAPLAESGELTSLPGVGKSTAEKIAEYLKTGKITRHEELRAKVPAGLPELMRLQGLGPKTAGKLWQQAKITSLAEFAEALENDPQRLLAVPGMGEKKLAGLRQALSFVRKAQGRFRLDEAEDVAEALVAAVKACRGVQRVEVAGSLRRRTETVGDIDIICQADARHAEAVMDAFVGASGVTRTLAKGGTRSSVVTEGMIQADLRLVPKVSFGSALQYFTGSKAHNIALRGIALKKKLRLNEYGLFVHEDEQEGPRVAGEDEEGIYRALGLAWVPPELREDRGEIAAATEGKLPRLLELSDIRGDLHMHTDASDGHNTIEEMILACRQAGYEYLAITDHSRSQYQANGLDERRMLRHAAAVRAAGRDFPGMLVLAGAEVDILKDGRLDYPDEVLAQLDFVTASPHAALNQDRQEATRRLIRAIENPHVHAIGHPSGRLINSRAGMDIDIEAIAKAAAANDTALELNADPRRLDLRDVHVRSAVEAGAKIVICTDAHRADDLPLLRYGVAAARRGWATPKDVINAWSPAKLREWLGR